MTEEEKETMRANCRAILGKEPSSFGDILGLTARLFVMCCEAYDMKEPKCFFIGAVGNIAGFVNSGLPTQEVREQLLREALNTEQGKGWVFSGS